MFHWMSQDYIASALNLTNSKSYAQYFCLFFQVEMGRRELLVTKVKKAFLEVLEKKDIRAFLASQETEVTWSDMCSLFLSLEAHFVVLHIPACN